MQGVIAFVVCPRSHGEYLRTVFMSEYRNSKIDGRKLRECPRLWNIRARVSRLLKHRRRKKGREVWEGVVLIREKNYWKCGFPKILQDPPDLSLLFLPTICTHSWRIFNYPCVQSERNIIVTIYIHLFQLNVFTNVGMKLAWIATLMRLYLSE